MSKGFAGMRRSRSRRFSDLQRRLRAHERQDLRPVPPEPVEAHDPEHSTGCLRCFVARGQQQRPGLNERS